MHWLTIVTAFTYSVILAFLVLVRNWSLLQALMATLGVAFGVVLAILTLVLILGKDTESFWLGFKSTLKAEFIGLLDLIRFK